MPSAGAPGQGGGPTGRVRATRRNVAARLVAEGGRRLGSLLLAVLIGRRLGLEGFGAHAYVTALCSLAAVGADFGLRTLMVREGASRGAGASEWAAQAFWLRQCLALVSAAALLLLAPHLDVDPWLVALGAVWVVLFAAVDSLGGWGLALREPGYEAGAAWIQRGGTVVLAALLLMAGWGLRGVWAGQAAGAAAALAFLLASRRLPRPRLASRPDPRLWGPIFTAALPLGLAAFASVLQTRVLWFLLERWQGKATLALFAAAAKFFELGQALPALVLGAAFPLLAESQSRDPEAVRRGAARLSRVLAAVMLPYAVVLAWRGRPLLEVFGKDFGGSQAAMPPLMLALLFSSWNFLWTALLVAAGDSWGALAGVVGAVAITSSAGALFLRTCGLAGVAWIQGSAEVWMTVFYLWRLRSRHGIATGWAGVAWRAAACGAAGSAAALSLPGLAGASAGVLAAAGTAWALGLLRAADRDLLRAGAAA